MPLCVAFRAVFLFLHEAETTSEDKTPVTDRQLSVMMFVDYGRTYGYQSMLAQIQVDTMKAELERERRIPVQMENLSKKDAVSQIESEIAQLKVNFAVKYYSQASRISNQSSDKRSSPSS